MPKISWKEFSSALALAATMAGCASVPKTARPLVHNANLAAIAGIRSWMEQESLRARSLSASGDIMVEQNGASNSASFSMKSKRLDHSNTVVPERIDSLSIEVSGPFGIKVARFMASPEQYEFYDILHDQTLSGRTDRESLQELTHLSGISLPEMSDLIYGIVRIDSDAEDSTELYSDNAGHSILVVREPGGSTSAYDLLGSANDSGHYVLVRYRRWPGTPKTLDATPILTVHFMEPAVIDGVSIPKHIEATAGENKLTLEYNHIELNPSSLTVRIKMP